MNIIRLNFKIISIWILVLFQILALFIYFYLQPETIDVTTNRILFFNSVEIDQNAQPTYHTLHKNIILKSHGTRDSYINFNSSLCFKNGTDLLSMKISNGINWNCKCLPEWHGSDCGQPEVLWRALLTNRRPIKIKGPRTFQRRLIYLFKFDQFTEHVADIRIHDLGNIVDLFVFYEEQQSDYLRRKLDNKFYKEYQHKILYVKEDGDNLWLRIKPYLKNLRNDDIILSSDIHEIPNRDALVFLKFHDQWPQPIKFRMRWSVFGFYWTHPSKTLITGGACTTSFLKETFNNNFKLLTDNKTISNLAHKGVLLGDLNHAGGWFCEYCNDAAQIVNFLSSKPKNVINWDEIDQQKIDTTYIEDLIGNGVYIDGKTQLVKAHKYRDNYFAPRFVIDHEWKYDLLMINFYAKLEYYEG